MVMARVACPTRSQARPRSQDLLVLADRALPLPALEVEVLLRNLSEGLGRGGRRRRIPLQPPRVERVLRSLAVPLGREAPLLLPVDLERVAPDHLPDLVPRRATAQPRAFLDGRHQGLLLFACGLDPVVVDCDYTGARVADPIHSP
jgi:hypothetical protein